MKKLFLLFTLTIMMSGCAAYYGNEAQYNKGDWYLLASSEEVARIKQDQLALEKLRNSPVAGDAMQGYKGAIYNNHTQYGLNFKLVGPEQKAYYINPGSYEVDYLIPGEYECRVYQGDTEISHPWRFIVSRQQQIYKGEKYHWYIFYDE